jgi:Recombinase
MLTRTAACGALPISSMPVAFLVRRAANGSPIKAIFENRNYTGTFTWAKRREGKYHSVAAGHIRERDRTEVTLSPAGKPHAVDNPREAWIVVEDAHEALIERALFERVQAKLHDRRRD